MFPAKVVHCTNSTYNLSNYVYCGRTPKYKAHLRTCMQCKARPLRLCTIGLDLIRLGNPYEVGLDGNRVEVLAKFRKYFVNRMASDLKYYTLVMSLKGKDLGCWCHPKSCHCDVYLLIANESL